jgi:polyisoprenoid-binding protein YceI
MKSASLAAAALVAVAFPALAAPETFTLDPNHTFPAFEVGHLGYSIQRGRFDKTSGKITLDTAAKAGSADITIEAASLSTGHPKLEQHLKGEDFFDVAKYPQIRYHASSFRFKGERLALVFGELTLHGVTKPVTLKAEHFHCADHPMLKKKTCGAELTATLKRSDFGISMGIPAVADDVKLRINIEAMKD